MWIDSHVHIGAFEEEKRLSILQEAFSAGVEKLINICTTEEDLEVGLALKNRELSSNKTPLAKIYNVGSITPHDVLNQSSEAFIAFAKAAREGHLVAIGETGLDYFYERSPRKEQKEEFVKYIQLALECELPLVIHCRDAFGDFFDIIRSDYAASSKNRRGVLHCFTGKMSEAKQLVDLGWMISVSGIATFKNAGELREVIRALPLDHLVIETDAPWLAPQSKRGQENSPAYVTEVGVLVADIKGISIDKCAEVTSRNTEDLFSLGE